MSPHQQPVRALRICVVENHSDTRHMLSVLLRQQGHELGLAESCAAARALFDAEAFDVLISDIAMPAEDGYMLIRRVRASADERVRRTPSIAVTAHAGSADRQRALDAGFDVHYAKPVDIDALVGTLVMMRAARDAADASTSGGGGGEGGEPAK